jgi:hypothetical protein
MTEPSIAKELIWQKGFFSEFPKDEQGSSRFWQTEAHAKAQRRKEEGRERLQRSRSSRLSGCIYALYSLRLCVFA